MRPPPRTPLATYRLQFNHKFPLAQGTRLAPYLAELGVSDIYAAPLFSARPGSLHGYDVVDPTRVDAQIGGERGLRKLSRTLRTAGMGLLLDVVPNHMAACHHNPWWMDVLEHGPASSFADFFDIDWELPGDSRSRSLRRRVLLPILGGPFGAELEAGRIGLRLQAGVPSLHYYEHALPVAAQSYRFLIEAALACAAATEARVLKRLLVAAQAPTLPPPRAQALKAGFAAICRRGAARRALRAAVDLVNGRPGDPASFSRLELLLNSQHYQLAFWRSAPHLVNYRRFFDINDLVAVRVEDPAVFARTHALIRSLLEEGVIQGLRIDHIDGLRDPRGYLLRLSRFRAGAAGAQPYVVVEKILAADETLPENWPTAGTTGYDFLNAVNGVFINESGLRYLRSLYARLVGDRRGLADQTYRLQKDVMENLFPAPVQTLSRHLHRLALADRYARDLSPADLSRALVEVTACLPAYRTYVDARGPNRADRRCVEHAAAAAERKVGDAPSLRAAIDFVRRVVLTASESPPVRRNWLGFTRLWQQLTGAVAAKGVEDTAFYRFHPLVSLNAVGADPERLTAFVGVGRFHARMLRRGRDFPATLNATSTHDSKRSEDVRGRISVLSEIPRRWERMLRRWIRLNARFRTQIDGAAVPDVNGEVFIYQNLLGVWPLDPRQAGDVVSRFEGFLVKANREAKLHTSWMTPNPEYETALIAFTRAILTDRRAAEFRREFRCLQRYMSYFGAINSLAQVVLKITAPGVPDFYQGNELWDFSLVDPDNRRPVDFAARRTALRALSGGTERGPQFESLLRNWHDGRIKLFVTREGLRTRARHREVFEEGEYVPLKTVGRWARHLIAFARRRGREWIATVVPRCSSRISQRTSARLGRMKWDDTAVCIPRVAPRIWRDCFTGNVIEADAASMTLPVQAILKRLPVAILASAPTRALRAAASNSK